ncbi:MAG TPA: extracellular solute-binding protein [Stellaceae bacterium]|nr:extracellular solute-binding protein [Stellaceae bacterium]
MREKTGQAIVCRGPAVTRRTVLRAAGGAAIVAPAVLRARPASAAGVLNITAYDGFIPPAFKQQFQKDTGIELRVRLASSQAPELNLLVAEREHPLSDLCTVTGNRIHQFVDAQVIEPLDVGRLRNWKAINPLYTESDWIAVEGATMAVPLLVGAEVLVYNTEKVQPPPDSWEAMFDPRYRGKTAYVIEDFLQCTMLLQGADPTFAAYVDKPEEAARAVNAARDRLIKNKSQVLKFYEDGAVLQQLLIGEDVVLAQAYAGTLAKLILAGRPIRLVIPREGSTAFVYNFAVVKGAANRDNAYRFLDALLAYPDIGAALTRSAGYSSTFLGAEASLNELERATFLLTPEQLKRLKFLSYKGQKLSSELIDRAVAEVEAG